MSTPVATTMSPWGNVTATPIKLNDVMDEELAAKLQREEEEEWEREIEAQFGDRHGVGWCFVEVPSTDCEFGVMSCIQQEVPKEEQASDPDDPDYAFALELQAQEAEEYDRLRRQEASSMERIQVMQEEPPKSRCSQHDFRASSTNKTRRPLQHYQSADFAVHLEQEFDYGGENGSRLRDANSDDIEQDHNYDDIDHDDEDLFLEDDLPIKKFNSLGITVRATDRKHPRRSMSSSSSSTSSSSSHQHHTARA